MSDALFTEADVYDGDPNCACGRVSRINGLCLRCYDREAPHGYAVCRTCGYETARGLPCGEPCV